MDEILTACSSLIQAVISNTTYGFQGNRGLHYDDYKKLGDLAFVQLSQLRHRGAFSTVTQCFTTCCVECGRSADPKTTRLPSEWYMQTILTIDLKASVLTRRSAGLPAMMTAVLTSNPVGDFFDSAMKKLQNIASRPVFTAHEHGKTGLPQVHAMNCIKDIFSSTQLGSDAERHLESSLQVAVRSLNHDIWSIRNCGGMLLKAILNRLSSKSVGRNSEIHQHSARTTYGKYPILAVVIETLLNSSLSINHINLAQTTNRQVNNGLPALDIINCVGIRGDRQEAIRYLLHQLLGSPVWLLRQRVAITLSRAFGSRTFVDELLKTIRSDMLADSVQSNTLHGQMICIKNCLLDLSETGQKDVLIHMISLFDALMAFSCSFIISAYLELLIELIGNLLGSVLPGSDQNLFDVIRQLHVELKKYHRGADQNELHRLDAHVSTWIYCYTEGHSQEIIPDKLNVPAVVELLRKYPVTIPSLYGRYEMIRMVRNHVIPDEHNVKRDQFPCLSTIQYLIGILTSDPSRWKENVSLGLNSDNEQCEELNECTKEILMACKGLENKNQAWKCAMLELQFAIVSYTQQGLDETLWEIWSKTVHLAICDQLVKSVLSLSTLTNKNRISG